MFKRAEINPTAKTVVWDLDHTLCIPNLDETDSVSRYFNAAPIPENIEILQDLYSMGFNIIIHTARRVLTHGQNIAAIEADVGQLTVDWLDKYEIPFHELVFGKPFGHYYIDDKAVNVNDLANTVF